MDEKKSDDEEDQTMAPNMTTTLPERFSFWQPNDEVTPTKNSTENLLILSYWDNPGGGNTTSMTSV